MSDPLAMWLVCLNVVAWLIFAACARQDRLDYFRNEKGDCS